MVELLSGCETKAFSLSLCVYASFDSLQKCKFIPTFSHSACVYAYERVLDLFLLTDDRILQLCQLAADFCLTFQVVNGNKHFY